MFYPGDKVMLRGSPRNPQWTCKDRRVTEPQFGMVYTVCGVGVADDPPYSGEPVIRLAEIESGIYAFASKYFMKLNSNDLVKTSDTTLSTVA
jgi:hypothetical protein